MSRKSMIELETQEKLHSIYYTHVENPEYTKRDLRMVTRQTPKMVNRYWEQFVEVKHVIRPWDEVMA